MRLETVVGLLVAVVVPLWLVFEQLLAWKLFKRSPRTARRQVAAGGLPGAPARSR